MLIQAKGKKKRRAPRHFKMFQHQGHGHPDKVHEAACTAGENGMYQAIERDANKIESRGPEYYTGNPHKVARLRDRLTSGVALGMSAIPKDKWEQAFGT